MCTPASRPCTPCMPCWEKQALLEHFQHGAVGQRQNSRGVQAGGVTPVHGHRDWTLRPGQSVR